MDRHHFHLNLEQRNTSIEDLLPMKWNEGWVRSRHSWLVMHSLYYAETSIAVCVKD